MATRLSTIDYRLSTPCRGLDGRGARRVRRRYTYTDACDPPRPGCVPAAEARLAEGPGAGLAELSAPQGAHAPARTAHGLRRGAVSEHRRMLASRHSHVHDSGRRVHAR